jgi:general secretion pathway protein A
MYTRFFGLNEKPFAITPDPRYLFMSERHGEGLAHLIYGVTESGGFIQLTGEVGTGKTTLVRSLLGQLPDEVDLALILNPQVTALEFLLSICEELGVELPADKSSSKALVDALNRHLLRTHAKGRRTILLVDEAQNLAEDVLEQVRLLTNLETAKQKLLQIILIGQPELRDLLAQNNLRQLAQRVTGRYHLEPLTRDEATRYIEHRLKVAGALSEIFDAGAKRAVYRLSRGIPRIMNVICDRALLGAYSEESRTVTRRIVRRAATEVSGVNDTPAWRWLLPTATLVLLTGFAFFRMQAGEAPATAAEPAVVPVSLATESPAAGLPVVTETAMDPEPAGAPDSEPLDAVLRRTPGNVDTAMRTLFRLWNVEFASGAGTGCAQAQRHGLSCLFQRGSWNIVRQLDRPAMLTLTDSAGDTHHPVVTYLDDDYADLDFGNETLRFTIDEVSEYWFGQYMLLWRPPNGEVAALRPGSSSNNVRWLRESLASLDDDFATTFEPADYFDQDLERVLMEFQRRNRLQVDGLAGQQTQILINSLLADGNTPRLSGGGQ